MLTERQQEICNFLVEYVDGHGYPPTVREIGERVGLASPSTVHAHLANLERAGLLRRDPTKPRALELLGRERTVQQPVADGDVVRLPLVGEIAAGSPLLAEQNIEEYVAMPSRAKGDFLLRVKGDSMVEAGILDGDLVIVKRAPCASPARERVARAAVPGARPDPRPRRGGIQGTLMPTPPRQARALPGAANLRDAASSPAPVASGYERRLRPCLTWFSRREDTILSRSDRR